VSGTIHWASQDRGTKPCYSTIARRIRDPLKFVQSAHTRNAHDVVFQSALSLCLSSQLLSHLMKATAQSATMHATWCDNQIRGYRQSARIESSWELLGFGTLSRRTASCGLQAPGKSTRDAQSLERQCVVRPHQLLSLVRPKNDTRFSVGGRNLLGLKLTGLALHRAHQISRAAGAGTAKVL
jgi:hypothetical protein